MFIFVSSAGSCSHCRYENGETKSKYQSALGIDTPPCVDGVADPQATCFRIGDHDATLRAGQFYPAGNFVERAITAGAQTRFSIDGANACAWGSHRLRRCVVGGAHAAFAAFAK